MANISNFVINGISYSYDTEARNPLAPLNKCLAMETGLIYGTDPSRVTAVDMGPDDKVKTPAEMAEATEATEDSAETKIAMFTAEVPYEGYQCTIDFQMQYKGNINLIDLKKLVVEVCIGDTGTRAAPHNEHAAHTFAENFEIYGFFKNDEDESREVSEDTGSFFKFVDFYGQSSGNRTAGSNVKGIWVKEIKYKDVSIKLEYPGAKFY